VVILAEPGDVFRRDFAGQQAFLEGALTDDADAVCSAKLQQAVFNVSFQHGVGGLERGDRMDRQDAPDLRRGKI
jgi:hypothetical protein